jgi:hypothetical protein
MSAYIELLRDPRWQKRRLEMLEKACWMCAECAAKDKTLHVHHLRYRKGLKPWEYGDGELRALCEDCHSRWHELKATLDESICVLSIKELGILVGFAQASEVFNGSGACFPIEDQWHRLGFAQWAAGASGLPQEIMDLDIGEALTPDLLNRVVNRRG